MNKVLMLVDKVTKAYEGHGDEMHTAVNKVSFEINRGEVFALLGPNGAGKTSLIKIILGLSKASSGRVLIDGIEVGKKREVKNIIGYVPEKVTFHGNLSAMETLNFYCDIKSLPRERVKEVIEIVGLSKYSKEKVGTFSKGMAQRVGLAQAILGKPQLLILDEPTSGLDPLGAIEFKHLIHDFNKEGITILFTSHIMSEVEELAQRVAIIKEGELQSVGTVKSIKQEAGLKSHMEIILKDEDEKIRDMVLAAGADEAVLDKVTLNITCKSELKAQILAVLYASNNVLLDVITKEPSLEEIFLKFLKQKECEAIA